MQCGKAVLQRTDIERDGKKSARNRWRDSSVGAGVVATLLEYALPRTRATESGRFPLGVVIVVRSK